MANNDSPNTGGSQFFINASHNTSLDWWYVDGMGGGCVCVRARVCVRAFACARVHVCVPVKITTFS